MATKTINLTGAEVAVTGLDGSNAAVRNDGADVLYVGRTPGITAGADEVTSIPAGQSAVVYGIHGAVYALGTGSALIISSDYNDNPFKSSMTSGSVMDLVAGAVSNPNLLINPDFRINQRGQTDYAITGFTVDRWLSQKFFTITPITTGIRIVPAEAISENLYGLCQNVPISTAMCGNDCTLTVNVAETHDYAHAAIYAYNTANSVVKSSDKIKLQTGINRVTIKKLPDTTAYIRVQFTIDSGAQSSDVLEVSRAKLELGGIATPYTPPDPALELTKCQRYYQIRSTNDIAAVDLRPSMATIKDIKLREDGNYEYIAE